MLIDKFLNTYSSETRKFLGDFNGKYDFKMIEESLHDLKNLKVLIVGDGIVDEYHYCEPMGKSAKANVIVNRYLHNEVFATRPRSLGNGNSDNRRTRFVCRPKQLCICINE